MKYYNNKVIIGIDHGYGNIKTAKHVFRTGVLKHDAEPLFTKNLLVYDGKYYTIGKDTKSSRQTSRRTEIITSSSLPPLLPN